MSVTIAIPTALRQFAGGKSQFQVEARTAGEALKQLSIQFGDLGRHLYDDKDKLRSFINVYVNDEDVRFSGGLNSPTADGDVVVVLPAVAGG